MAPKPPCAKYQYVVTTAGPKILPVDEPACKDEESPADYNAGGYLPVKVNDSFKQGRYRVVRKLGWGHFSTVWLVKDAESERHSALKVVKSAGRYAETARDEIKLLSRVESFSPDHPGRPHVVSFLDSFTHTTPEASHICIVFEPLGENLLALIERHKKKGVPRALVRVIAKQVLLGLQYLHDECDLVHTDIKPENILISIPDVESHIHHELSQSPLPTSRRVGVPLPTKFRHGVSIPQNQQRPRRQVQIFNSQPLASPVRSAGKSGNGSLSNGGSGVNSVSGSYVAQMQISRLGSSGVIGFASGTVASLSSSAPKGLGAMSNSSRPKPPVSGDANPSSPSTSSSSSSISSTLVSTAPGLSSVASTPATSLPQSLGSALISFASIGKPLSSKERLSSLSEGSPNVTREKAGSAGVRQRINKHESESGLSSSWKDRLASSLGTSLSWRDRLPISLSSSPKSASNISPSGSKVKNGRSHLEDLRHASSGLSVASAWKDPGTAALAPALVVSASVRADGEEAGNFFHMTSASSTTGSSERPYTSGTHVVSTSSSATVTGARPSPSGTPYPPEGAQYHKVQSPKLNGESSSQTPNQPASLLTQTAPRSTAPVSVPLALRHKPYTRPSPNHHFSHLSAHLLDKPSPNHNSCANSVICPNPQSFGSMSPASLTPTPMTPALQAPPPTPAASSLDLPATSPLSAPLPPIDTNVTSLPPVHPVWIKIADLGNATPSQKHFTEDIQTRQYRAPEAILGRKDWGTRVDIWSVACVIFELLTAEYLFDPQGQGEMFTKDDDHMAQIIELMGDFSVDAKMGGKYSRELFDATGALRYIRTLKPWPLKRVMMEKYLYTDADATGLCDFLEPMLAPDMKDRKDAKDMLDHTWMRACAEDEPVDQW
ncbi:serine/threonine protein kinase, CMGC group [Pleurotus ostreatus]|uniref:non-specific serine/threonine protein kinase n=1 Tax=Pleurotus ostreatus TaxID=5322 RepID=A0A8H7DWZ1_PLEOS|nr:serine/threonine protein kinase, CMGC group [Pleurotus ostreatus]KAF7437138.1 serine/threonine protein kinase, CMGC group [Pleurotus ostreatus]KAJ8703006.1 hypothetical protein PTI98_001666 [Pleurotus ostreatus]